MHRQQPSPQPSPGKWPPIRLGLTMGDPLGIGPEVLLKALAALPELLLYSHGAGTSPWLPPDLTPVADRQAVRVTLYGCQKTLDAAPGPPLPLEEKGLLSLVSIPHIHADSHRPLAQAQASPPGRILSHDQALAAGRTAFACLERGVEDLVAGRIDALVTGPVDKHRISLASGAPFRGQTEYLAHRFGKGADDVVMLLAGPVLRVALATTHLALRDVPSAITKETLRTKLMILAEGLRNRLGIANPRIGVTALNPHAGDHGLFGSEEQTIISPAIEEVRSMGWDVRGPFPADGLFPVAAAGHLDAVLAMYHDQGLGPLKVFHVRSAANITLGLDGIRSSPDHGTADDIQGQGVAHPGSMVQAMVTAMNMVTLKRLGQGIGGGQRVESIEETRNRQTVAAPPGSVVSLTPGARSCRHFP